VKIKNFKWGGAVGIFGDSLCMMVAFFSAYRNSKYQVQKETPIRAMKKGANNLSSHK
jgi:hypothetical protein